MEHSPSLYPVSGTLQQFTLNFWQGQAFTFLKAIKTFQSFKSSILQGFEYLDVISLGESIILW